jgi:hypothetical protein
MHVPSGVATLFVFIAVGVATLFKRYFIGVVMSPGPGIEQEKFQRKKKKRKSRIQIQSAVQCLEVVFNLTNTKGRLLHQNYSFL